MRKDEVQKPILRMPDQLNVTRIADQIESMGIYTFRSEARRATIYAYRQDEISIITASNGVLRLNLKDAKSIGKELISIANDLTEMSDCVNCRRMIPTKEYMK